MALLVNVICEISSTDEPWRFLGASSVRRDGQLLQASTSLRFWNRQPEIFLANTIQRYFRLTEFGKQAKVGRRNHAVSLPVLFSSAGVRVAVIPRSVALPIIDPDLDAPAGSAQVLGARH